MRIIRKRYFVHLVIYALITTTALVLLIDQLYVLRRFRTNQNELKFSDDHNQILLLDSNYLQYYIGGTNWFMNNQQKWPYLKTYFDYRNESLLFPDFNIASDRIIEQLIVVPNEFNNETSEVKKILLVNGFQAWNIYDTNINVFETCPVQKCELTITDSKFVDALLFKDHFSYEQLNRNRLLSQVWILYLLECPLYTYRFPTKSNVINLTATYRFDSDIVTPYEKWVYYSDYKSEQNNYNLQTNYAANRTKKVAWFVSNCSAKNKRLEYVRELEKYIQVDIYGACGEMQCSRKNQNECYQMLQKDYKFYLAFENSNCRDYITEKFYVNGLKNDILPIVMGAKREDYSKVAPEKSYIHVDEFDSPKNLAQYLHYLDENDDLYNEYFKWKTKGEFINTYFWCRLCTMLHVVSSNSSYYKSYDNINDWWQTHDKICLDCKNRDDFCSW